MIKCGDFSAWNGNINWDRVKAAGLTHAILKVIRRDFEPDEQFENNWKGCQLAGVHICGVYNYVYTPTVEEAVAAATARGRLTRRPAAAAREKISPSSQACRGRGE